MSQPAGRMRRGRCETSDRVVTSEITKPGGSAMTMLPTRVSMIGTLACAMVLGTISAAPAQTQLKVMVFPGLSNVPIFAAQHKNLFAKHGLAIELLNTPNS